MSNNTITYKLDLAGVDWAAMKRILVVHHSASGGTRALVSAFRDAAQTAAGIQVLLRSAAVATADELKSADALVIATPENFGYMAGSVKEFFDRTPGARDRPAMNAHDTKYRLIDCETGRHRRRPLLQSIGEFVRIGLFHDHRNHRRRIHEHRRLVPA